MAGEHFLLNPLVFAPGYLLILALPTLGVSITLQVPVDAHPGLLAGDVILAGAGLAAGPLLCTGRPAAVRVLVRFLCLLLQPALGIIGNDIANMHSFTLATCVRKSPQLYPVEKVEFFKSQ